MSTVERKEYQQSQIYRSVSPVRTTRTSTQNLTEFDNNLDNLLEDLQSSVSRPGSSLGNRYQSARTVNNVDNRTNSLNRVTQAKPSNPVTEYSSDDAYSYTSPDGTKSVKTYKKESYSYNTAGDSPLKTNQLDSLLDELQQVKHSSFGKESYDNVGSDPGYQDKVSKKTTQRELHYGDAPRSSSRGRTFERIERDGSSSREFYSGSEGTYGDLKSVRHTTPSPTRSNTSTLSKQTKVTNVHTYPMEVHETTTSDFDHEVLADLDPHLIPSGNTKVTTTIKTYEYEIPGSGTTTAFDNEKYVYSNQSQSTPSKSFVYNKAESKSRFEDESRWNREEKFYEKNVVDQKVIQKPAPVDKTVIEEIFTQNYESGPDSHGDHKSLRRTTPFPTRSNTSTLSKQTKASNVHTYPVEVIESKTPDIAPEVLANLDPHILPSGNTKVTTTIKTYEYEIPGAGNTSALDTEKYVYSPNQSQTTPSKSFVYNKAESKARYDEESRWNRDHKVYEKNVVDRSLYQKPAPPGQTVIKETVTTRNYQPGYSPEMHRKPTKPTYVYNETVTTKNLNQNGFSDVYSQQPPVNRTLVTKETQTINRNVDYPPTNQTVVHSSQTTTNKYSPGERPNRDVEVFDPKRPPYPGPNKPVNISYQYQSSKSMSNNYSAESEPLLPPFPTNEVDGPPKRIEDLMASIGHEPPNSPYNAAFTAHEQEIIHQKKIDVLKHQHEDEMQKSEPKHIQSTKNVTGPPVYYPPGHEMFAKKEESGAWRAEGAMAREKGKYEYEAKEKSKSKGGSGAAIVPVCLPLCCGLPCTIL